MAFVTGVFTTRGGVAGKLALMAATLKAWVREYALRRATFRELSALSDRELDDLGLRRDDIARIAAESARQA
ncbi:DUF1127 domain-containing protein [Rhodovulum marinum]|uniref:Uncharacterized protein YjiS (DUF1127 family) n=1 Tax=Rhodovulum marinum TaxID=320662 RepID=A0A4R2Q0T0_9RHOB|nr:DUF1127 domain-containing protein [Rhodovulum marinum]TCP41274.1 uncharacterized protein YjiS (DUF1127 family) [Rhodovulum marinum]